MNSTRTVMNKTMFVLIVSAFLANFSGIAVFAADDKAPLAKNTAAKTDDKPLIVLDKIPTDPAENAKLAKEILEIAEKTMKGEGAIKTFTAWEEKNNPTNTLKSKLETYVKFNPDGTEWRRLDLTIDGDQKSNPVKKTWIRNNDGYWTIIGDTAIKKAYEKNNDANGIETAPDVIKHYNIGNSTRDGIACFIVTRKFVKNDKIIKIKEYAIGSADYFIRMQKEYDENGKEDAGRDLIYRNVKTNVSIDDSLFKIDGSLKVHYAQTSDEFIGLTVQTDTLNLLDQTKITEEKKKEYLRYLEDAQ